MSEEEIIEGEFTEEIGKALEPVQHGTLFHTDEPSEMLRKATLTATSLAQVVRKQGLVTVIQGREHCRVEAWTLLGSMLGVFPVTEWTRETANGWEARVEARTLSGAVVGAAEAQCDRSENTWKNRDGYALRSMAQTRATSKALRQPLGFVMQLAGFDPTPAEEMPRDTQGNFGERRVENAGKGVAVPKSWAALTKLVSSWDEDTHDTFMAFCDSCRRLNFPDVETKDLAKADKDWLFQKAAGAAVLLREQFEPTELPYPTVDQVRAVFAQVLDGQELAIPDETLDAEAADAAERDA